MLRSIFAFTFIANVILGVSPSHADLVLWYTFDEGSGSTAVDHSGNHRDLTKEFASRTDAWRADGAFGGAYSFGDFTDYRLRLGVLRARANSADSPDTITSIQQVTGNQVTVAFWAQASRENNGSSPFYFSKGSARIIQGHVEWIDGTTYFDAAYDVKTANRVSANAGAVSDAWHHYVMQYDGDSGDAWIYKDNTLLAHTAAVPGGAINWSNIDNIELGAQSGSSYWTGSIDDFAVWNEVIDADTRTLIFESGVAAVVPEPSSLVLLSFGVAGISARVLRRRRS